MKITYKDWVFNTAERVTPVSEQSLSCENISANTLTAVVRCSDPEIMKFAKNDPVRYWENDSDASMQTYYLRSITRIGETAYKLIAWSAVGLLATMVHKGGIYTGQTVEEVVREICGSVPVVVKSGYKNIKLYGWLPYCRPQQGGKGSSARDNLAQVLFAIGAYLTTDLNGVLHVDALWGGTISTIESKKMYLIGGRVEYADPISTVVVTEHQYIESEEDKELFSGTSQNGDVIVFSEPMHSLTATGFDILESGANYARISSGSGTLKGKLYIHNTRLVTKKVIEDTAENVKSVTDKTLVSLVNSSAVATRLAQFYKCRETIINGILSGAEKPGHVISIYHPYDKKMLSACIQVLDTTVSATTKSEMTALVGFVPKPPENSEYYDERIVLTGKGEWTPPEGTTEITAVLIGQGENGLSGADGENGKANSIIVTGQEIANGGTWSCEAGKGGKGGEGGEGGKGGKVYRVGISLSSLNKIPFDASGQNAIFGDFSSEHGASSDLGYQDLITGETYATKGESGVNGGAGGSGGSMSVSLWGSNGEDAGKYTGGAGSEGSYSKNNNSPIFTTEEIFKGGSGGGGAAIASNGEAAPSKSVAGNGADATTPPTPGVYGKGGTGGNGGGGGGGGGAGYYKYGKYTGSAPSSLSGIWYTTTAGQGGVGSDGSAGGPACIILYYRIVKNIRSGAYGEKNGKLMLDRTGRLLIV